MKSITGFALGLAAVLAVPAAMADDDSTKSKSTTTTSTDSSSSVTTTETETKSEDGATSTSTEIKKTEVSTPTSYGGGPVTTTTSTTTTDDYYVHEGKKDDDSRRVRAGLGINAFGAAGAADEARWGIGGRIEYVTRIGLSLGGSYTQHFTSENDRTAVRPLLGEIGWALPVAKHLEIRPMVGLGYAFATGTSETSNTGSSAQNASVSGSVSGFDVAPGAKVSYVARMLEIYTLPKYHIISGNNFAGIELGAGARF